MNPQLHQLCKDVHSQDTRALARLLTEIENTGEKVLENKWLLDPPQASFRLGLTGPPGAGKSTLINELIKAFRTRNKSVGVIAVDPSSSLTQGAILGDRIRYSEHFLDPQVFIRSLGSRGSLGGLSASTYLMLRAYDLFSFDVVLIETVGVGQTELEIVNVADQVGIVLVPESGDSIQIMKAGVLEVANFYIVNKSDRPGASALTHELQVQHGAGGAKSKSPPPTFQTTATKGEGLEPLIAFIETTRTKDLAPSRKALEKLRKEALALLRAQFERDLYQKIQCIHSLQDFKNLLSTPLARISHKRP